AARGGGSAGGASRQPDAAARGPVARAARGVAPVRGGGARRVPPRAGVHDGGSLRTCRVDVVRGGDAGGGAGCPARARARAYGGARGAVRLSVRDGGAALPAGLGRS